MGLSMTGGGVIEAWPQHWIGAGHGVGEAADGLAAATDLLCRQLAAAGDAWGDDDLGLTFFNGDDKTPGFGKARDQALSDLKDAVNVLRGTSAGLVVTGNNYAAAEQASTVGGSPPSAVKNVAPQPYELPAFATSLVESEPPPAEWLQILELLETLVAGCEWPRGNVGQIQAMCDAFNGAAATIDGVQRTLVRNTQAVIASNAGLAAEEFASFASLLHGGGNGVGMMQQLAAECRGLAAFCDTLARQEQAALLQFGWSVDFLFVTYLGMQALATFTDGMSMAAFLPLAETEAEGLVAFLRECGKQVLIGAWYGGGMDTVGQLARMHEGLQTGFDVGELVKATGTAAVAGGMMGSATGLVSAGAGRFSPLAGLSRLLSAPGMTGHLARIGFGGVTGTLANGAAEAIFNGGQVDWMKAAQSGLGMAILGDAWQTGKSRLAGSADRIAPVDLPKGDGLSFSPTYADDSANAGVVHIITTMPERGAGEVVPAGTEEQVRLSETANHPAAEAAGQHALGTTGHRADTFRPVDEGQAPPTTPPPDGSQAPPLAHGSQVTTANRIDALLNKPAVESPVPPHSEVVGQPPEHGAHVPAPNMEGPDGAVAAPGIGSRLPTPGAQEHGTNRTDSLLHGSHSGPHGSHEASSGAPGSHGSHEASSGSHGSHEGNSGPEQTAAIQHEAQQFIGQHGASMQVDFTGVDPSMARDITDGMRRLAEQDPARFRELDYTLAVDFKDFFPGDGLGHGGHGEIDSYAIISGDGKGILLNTRSFDDAARFMADGARQEVDGYTVPGGGTPRGVFDHEVGHFDADEVLAHPGLRDALNTVVSEHLGTRYDAQAGHDPALRTAIEDRLSVIGGENPHQMVAEAMTEYRNAAEPRPLATAIGDLVADRAAIRQAYDDAHGVATRPEDTPVAIHARPGPSSHGADDGPRMSPGEKIAARLKNLKSGASEFLGNDPETKRIVKESLDALAAKKDRAVGEPAHTPRAPVSDSSGDNIEPGSSLYDSVGERDHYLDLMEDANLLAELHDAAQTPEERAEAAQETDAFIRQNGLADHRELWHKFKGAAQTNDWLAYRDNKDVDTGIGHIADSLMKKFGASAEYLSGLGLPEGPDSTGQGRPGARDRSTGPGVGQRRDDEPPGPGTWAKDAQGNWRPAQLPPEFRPVSRTGREGLPATERPVDSTSSTPRRPALPVPPFGHDDFGPIDIDRRSQVPLANLRPQRTHVFDRSFAPLSDTDKAAMRRAHSAVTDILTKIGGRPIKVGDLLEFIQHVNPTGSRRNCAEASMAIDDILRGRPAVAGPLLGVPVPGARGAYKPRSIEARPRLESIAEVETLVRKAGPGSHGIIIANSGTGTSHVYNVININGGIYYIDGQLQRVFPGAHPANGKFKEYDFYRTG